MNKVYFIYRFNEQGEKQYYHDCDTGSLFCTDDFQEVGEKIWKLGGWHSGWECEIFYNPIQD